MGPLKILGYVVWFIGAFVWGVYLTFPLDDMKSMIVSLAENELGKGKQGAHGSDPHVEVGSLTLSGFGVKAERVVLQLGSRNPDPGPTLQFDSLAVGIRPWSLVTKAKTVTLDADLYGGSVDASLSMDDKGNIHEADIDIDAVDLSKLTLVQERLGVPMAGMLAARAKLDLGPNAEKEGEGSIKLDVRGIAVGPGNLKLGFGDFELPTINLGDLKGEIPVKQGKGSLTGVKLDGKDLQAELLGDVFLKGKIGTSRLDVDGWFQPMAAFLEREKKFQAALDLGNQLGLGKAKDDDGHYWFSAKGTLQSPATSLSRDQGKRAKGKSGKPSKPSAEDAPIPAPPPPPDVPG